MKSGFLLLLAITAGAAQAVPSQAWLCSHGDSERAITVEYQGEQTVPCAVTYNKQGETQTLWNAGSEQGYCEAKAEAFVDKHRGWGWQCELSVAADADDSLAAGAESEVDEELIEVGGSDEGNAEEDQEQEPISAPLVPTGIAEEVQ